MMRPGVATSDPAEIELTPSPGVSPTIERGKRCRLVLRFLKHSKSAYHRLVAGFVSSPVHVDVVLDSEGTQLRRACFSAYMNEKFSMTLMPPAMVHDEAYENLALDVCEEDIDRLSRYLGAMVDTVPYNYSDSIMLLPSIPHGGVFVETMIQDVAPKTPPTKISSVFCSQAALLAIRECVSGSPWLGAMLGELAKANSRLCSPADLYRMVLPHARVISNAELEAGWPEPPLCEGGDEDQWD